MCVKLHTISNVFKTTHYVWINTQCTKLHRGPLHIWIFEHILHIWILKHILEFEHIWIFEYIWKFEHIWIFELLFWKCELIWIFDLIWKFKHIWIFEHIWILPTENCHNSDEKKRKHWFSIHPVVVIVSWLLSGHVSIEMYMNVWFNNYEAQMSKETPTFCLSWNVSFPKLKRMTDAFFQKCETFLA